MTGSKNLLKFQAKLSKVGGKKQSLVSFQDQKILYCSKEQAEIIKRRERKETAFMRQLHYQGCVLVSVNVCVCVHLYLCLLEASVETRPTVISALQKRKTKRLISSQIRHVFHRFRRNGNMWFWVDLLPWKGVKMWNRAGQRHLQKELWCMVIGGEIRYDQIWTVQQPLTAGTLDSLRATNTIYLIPFQRNCLCGLLAVESIWYI